jgi:NAD(P)-dependent dehydrogenase (short-subunit alcohol dehydrogenase family)
MTMTLPAHFTSDLLQDDVAVVTGAAQGNGRAIALGLAQHSARVMLVDIQPADAVQQEINERGGHALSVTADVTARADCAEAIEFTREKLGVPSILVNNAGILRRGAITDESFESDWEDTFRVNVDGTKNMIVAALPSLRDRRGRIVNVGSIQSYVAVPNSVAYTATKGAIAQLTKALAIEFATDGIRVNGIAPGVMATPMTEVTRSDPQKLNRFLQHIPLHRVGEPEELVGPVLFLVSALSTYVTGVMLPVDGGYLAS